MKESSSTPLHEAERHTLVALNGISVLRQLSEHLELSSATPVLEELVGLAKAQRRALNAALRRLKADPLLAHFLETRDVARQAEYAGGKKREQLVRESFFIAQSKGFTGRVYDWGTLLSVCPKPR